MSNYSAEELSRAGDRFLGRSYDEMDCQEFIEQCLRIIGLVLDLKGSNAWYRKMTWTGTPEECKARFGRIPEGAFLFILEFDGGEEKRGYHDGKGNASHIGMVTHRNDGAIHSSASRGCVATSVFKDKTIKNGGWNRVGLWDKLSYGAKIDALLRGQGSDPDSVPAEPDKDPDGGEETVQAATVWAANGKPVKMRSSCKEGTTGYSLYDELPVGTTVDVVQRGDEWSQVNYGLRRGWWIKSAFLVFGDVVIDPGESAADPEPVDDPDPGEVELTIRLTKEEAAILLAIVDRISWQLVQILGGRG